MSDCICSNWFASAPNLECSIHGTGAQPLPVATDHPVVHHLVQADLEARLQVGIGRYGQPLQPHNGRDALRDLYEELLDACVYIRQRIYEEENS